MVQRLLILVLALFALVAGATAQVPVTTQVRWVKGGLPGCGYTDVSPDGKLFVNQLPPSGSGVSAISVFTTSGEFVTSFALPIANPSPFSFSLDSKLIYTHVGKGVIGAYDVRTGKRMPDLLRAEKNVYGQVLSPDGTRIAICEGDNAPSRLKIYQLSNLSVVFTHENVGDTLPSWSPDSKYLLVGINGFQTLPGNYAFLREYSLKPDPKTTRCPFFSNTDFLFHDSDHPLVFVNAATGATIKESIPDAIRQNLSGTGSNAASPDKRFAYVPVVVRDTNVRGEAKILALDRSLGLSDPKRFQVVSTGVSSPTSDGEVGFFGIAVNPLNGDLWVPVSANQGAIRIALIKNTKDGHVFSRYVTSRDVTPSFVATGQRGSARMVATLGGFTAPNYGGTEVYNADNGNFLFRANVQNGPSDGVLKASFSPNGEFLAISGTEVDKDRKGVDGVHIYATATGTKVSAVMGNFTSALFVSNTRLLVTNFRTNLIEEYTLSPTGVATFKQSANPNGNAFWAFDPVRGRALMMGITASSIVNTNDLTVVSQFDSRAPFVSGTFAFDGSLITASRTGSPNNVTIDKWNVSGKAPTRVGTSLVFPFVASALTQVMAAPNGDWFVQTSNEEFTYGGPYVHRLIRASDLKVIAVDENPPIKEGAHFYALSPDGGTFFGAHQSGPLYALAVPPMVQTLTISPTTVAGGTSATGTVRISTFPAAAGTTVTLSSNSSAAVVPPTLLISASNTGTFEIKTKPVAVATVVRITATVNGVSRFADLTITPPTLNTLTLEPNVLIGGKPSVGTVAFTGPVSVDTVVALKSDVAAATVAANVTVPAGKSSATFSITTKPVATKTVASISATSGSVTKKADLTINPPQVNFFTVVTPIVVGGGTVEAMLTLDGPAPAGGLPLTIVSGGNGVPGISIVVPAGETSLGFSIDSSPILTDTTVSVSIKESNSPPIAITVQAPRLLGVMGKPESIRAGATTELTVLLNGASPGALRVGATSTDGLTVSAATVTVPSGATTFTLTVTAKKPRANLYEKVTLELNGRRLNFDLRVTP